MMPRCVHCGQSIKSDREICPACGGEQPVEWMVKLVYVLAFLFVQGVVYRLIWPEAESILVYGIYFIITGGLVLAARRFLRGKTGAF